MPLLTTPARIAALIAVLLAAGGCGSKDFKADPSGVNGIRTVAVVAFAVPKYITEDHGGSNYGGLSGLAQTITKYSTGGETLGNGKAAAGETAEGFIAAMERSGRWRIVPLADVTRNDEIRGLARLYDQNMNGRMAGPDGLPVIRLRMDSKPSEFAHRAAFVLDVDGVMMLDASDMSYVRHASVAGSGVAKARAMGTFTLYDRDGNPVWESRMAVGKTEASAPMIAGVVVRSKTPELHRSVGEGFAADLLKRYSKKARS
ncbi:MAG: hypothetical protein OEN55_11945 [Alphaproteobacteria bacterium]|nr:hypothetical protein [Alphaproteobacteria bacterium]